MNELAQKYLMEEIVEEGDLYICFKYLENNFHWGIGDYQIKLRELSDGGVTGFYRYDNDDEIVDIEFSEIDFSHAENMMGINFSPM